MPYSKLLTKVIEESGYTATQIVEKCREKGKNIDKSYISKLQNNKIPPPSEEISRTIANICDIDERLLVIEGYIDKAPKEIKEAFISIKMASTVAALHYYKNKIDKQTLDEIENEMNKEPISDFIISLLDNKNININDNGTENLKLYKENNGEISLMLTEPIALRVTDNAMFPIVPENAKINLLLQDEYKNGDLLAIKIKDKEETFVRYVLFNDNEIILNTLNTGYEQIILKKEDIIIMGKVHQVITNI